MLKNRNWFIKFKQKNNPSVRLFCFHYGGGSASTFSPWAQDIAEGAELIAIQLPGREGRYNEPLLYTVSEIVEQLCINFNEYLGLPCIFFGHSLGALIAFELICALRKNGMIQPKHFITSGTKAPHLPFNKQHIHDLPDSNFIDELRKFNGIPNAIIEDKELISIFLPIIRADFHIFETYKYFSGEPLSLPITALGGLNDDTFDHKDLLKWKEMTTCSFKYYFLQGNHFFIKSSYKDVIRIVNQVLNNEIL
jgi:medium-chain acyl-[acyl-carrier-protein] hydrolase